jgi:hypothetical protein
MSSNPKRAIVRHVLLEGQPKAKCLAALATVCSTGAQSAEVQGSPLASQALGGLKSALDTAQGSLTKKQEADQAQKAASKVLLIDYAALGVAARAYEAAVGVIAGGDAGVINKAGLLSREPHSTVPAPLGKVAVVRWKPGKHSADAILTWPKGPGATGYAIEVNYTPANPSGPWTALTSGTGRRRVVKAPAPGGQILARVASLGSGGTQSEWSDPILVTTAF